MPIPRLKNTPINIGRLYWAGVVSILKSEMGSTLACFPDPVPVMASVERWPRFTPFIPCLLTQDELFLGRKQAGNEVFYLLTMNEGEESLVQESILGQSESRAVSQAYFYQQSRAWQAGYLLKTFVERFGYVPHLAVGVTGGGRWLDPHTPWDQIGEFLSFSCDGEESPVQPADLLTLQHLLEP